MLNRQRLILALIRELGADAQNIVLVKLAFLLREETAVGRDRSFYGFVPYKHGPFSFGMYRELEALERDGYLQRGNRSTRLTHRTKKLTREQIERLPPKQLEAAISVVQKYGRQRTPELLRSIYRRYPWYATKSELHQYVPDDVPSPVMRQNAAYTVGYEGKSVDGFFNQLLASGIEGILDVRANPVSRKYGFAKRSMRRIAERLDLRYHHIPELGIAGDQRANLSDFNSYQRLLDKYERTMLPDRAVHVTQAAALLNSRPTALLCMERDVRCCHRGRLANRIAADSGLTIEHL